MPLHAEAIKHVEHPRQAVCGLPPSAACLALVPGAQPGHIVDDLDPDPAYVLGRRWDALYWNRAA